MADINRNKRQGETKTDTGFQTLIDELKIRIIEKVRSANPEAAKVDIELLDKLLKLSNNMPKGNQETIIERRQARDKLLEELDEKIRRLAQNK